MPLDVVFLSQRVPFPPDRGDRISTYHILRHLRQIGARVRVGALCEDERDEQAAVELGGLVEEICAPRIHRGIRKLTCMTGLLTGKALTLPFFADASLQRRIDEWLDERRPDLVFAYSSSMAQYVMHHPEVPRVMHFAELDSDKWRQYAAASGALGRFIYGREARCLLEYEREIARSFDASIVVSPAERELFLEQIPDVEPLVLPNGVDVEHFASKGEERRDPHRLIFTGVMDYEPNVDGCEWFVEHCWPAIRAEYPDASFVIVGNRPVPRVERLAEVPGVEVTGWVEETPSWFDGAAVAIAPLRLARGLQNKVLEAMSMGLPTVSSTPAARGLGQVDDDALIVEDDAAKVIAQIRSLFAEPQRARTIGANAARWVREHFVWEHSFAKLDQLFATLGREQVSPEGVAR